MRVSSLLAVLPVAQLGSAFVAPCACGTTQAIQNGQSSRCATQTKRGRATGRIRPAVRGTSMASSMASEPWTGEDKEISQEIPDDPEELMVGVWCREIIPCRAAIYRRIEVEQNLRYALSVIRR